MPLAIVEAADLIESVAQNQLVAPPCIHLQNHTSTARLQINAVNLDKGEGREGHECLLESHNERV